MEAAEAAAAAEVAVAMQAEIVCMGWYVVVAEVAAAAGAEVAAWVVGCTWWRQRQ